MVIECTACHTRFKLADDKIKPGGTKVRCSKCKQIFSVMPPEPAPAPPPAAPSPEEGFDFGAFNMERLPEPDQEPAAPPPGESAGTALARESAETAAGEFSFGPESKEEFAFGGQEEAGQPDEFSFGESRPQSEEAAADQQAPEEFSFAGEEEAEANRFDFGEKTGDQAAAAASASDTSEGFTFGGEEDTGPDEFAFGGEAEAPAAADTLGFDESEEFSFEGTGSSASVEFAFDEENAAAETGTEFSWDAEEGGAGEEGFAFGEGEESTAGADEFDFSGITFGEEDVAAPSGLLMDEEPAPPQAQAAPLETGALREELVVAVPRATTAPLPASPSLALPAASRRKSPFRGLTSFIGLLLLALVGTGVYFYWQGGIPELTNLIDRLTGQAVAPQAGGQIRLEGLSSFYVANQEVGQLLVIQGKAVNDYPQPRSSLGVKGVLFNAAGQPLLQQTAFCGNPLEQEALGKLPYGKIEESMNNPFGESLSNLNVAPGKSLPFTIVFRNLPADIAEFTVEATDSKPGTKQ